MEYRMSTSEQLIMEILWSCEAMMSITEIGNILQQQKNILWKRQTINTFLARLIKKGLVVQNGREYTYAYSIDDYKKLKAEEFLQEEYNGSLKRFVAALSGSQKIDKQEYEELIEYLNTYK